MEVFFLLIRRYSIECNKYVLRIPFAANASKNFDSSTNMTALGYVRGVFFAALFGWWWALKKKKLIELSKHSKLQDIFSVEFETFFIQDWFDVNDEVNIFNWVNFNIIKHMIFYQCWTEWRCGGTIIWYPFIMSQDSSGCNHIQ